MGRSREHVYYMYPHGRQLIIPDFASRLQRKVVSVDCLSFPRFKNSPDDPIMYSYASEDCDENFRLNMHYWQTHIEVNVPWHWTPDPVIYNSELHSTYGPYTGPAFPGTLCMQPVYTANAETSLLGLLPPESSPPFSQPTFSLSVRPKATPKSGSRPKKAGRKATKGRGKATSRSCRYCGYSHPKPSNVTEHQRRHLPPKVPCGYPGCGVVCGRSQELERHRRTVSSVVQVFEPQAIGDCLCGLKTEGSAN